MAGKNKIQEIKIKWRKNNLKKIEKGKKILENQEEIMPLMK